MNTRRSFVRSMLGAAALAVPFVALTKHAGAHDAVLTADYFDEGDFWDYTPSADGFVTGFPDENDDVVIGRWPEYEATSIIAQHCEVVRVEQMPDESFDAYTLRAETARAAVQATVNRMNLIVR